MGCCGHEVAVAGPDANLFRHLVEQHRRGAASRDLHAGVPELALRGRRHPAAQGMRHQLHPVADAEHRPAQVEQGRIAPRRPRIRDALWPA